MRTAIRHLKRADPVLAAIIGRVGPFGMKYTEPSFHGLVRSIVFQQLSGAAATPIFNRLLAAAGPAPLAPAAILRLHPDEMRALGLSRQKAAYIRDLAELTVSREVRFEILPSLSDDEVIGHLTRVKGIGVWTAHMFLIFALRRPDVLPTGDLGIRNAVGRAYRLNGPAQPTDVERVGQVWRPYCSVASWYLWRSLELDS
ncbi:MAG: DNA-3-methyladenine glycosylase 2 family protein [Acidobacteria bacterium]|nr:DNA-3-methyladenine glycosylase 2 family protein [Acidobacteriota bacterium]MBI3278560.1 DNA-3-methyladenine glycosylase 2 family protein [Acidobacteriota bacterium]